ncbi:MAG: cytochrome c [Alphaproteobacteria bacterium]|nr:cytochrome c [Alphaproteobacteria bacterium]
MARLLVIGFVLGATAIASAAEPSVKRGRDLYMNVGCYLCHGTEGQGSGAGLKLTPDPLPAEAIANFIRNTDPTTPSFAAMPSYSEKVLSDADVADIAAFLASIPAPKSPDSIPALKDLKPGK